MAQPPPTGPSATTESSLPERYRSYWSKTARRGQYPRLAVDREFEVAVVGGGIVGVTAALMLKREGVHVCLLEARRIGSGVTGHTTAKLSSLHGLTYARLADSLGEEPARAYGEANEAGLRQVSRFVRELEIDCDFRRKPNFTYSESPEGRRRIEEEVAVASGLGLPATLVDEVEELPFPITAAVRFDDQAEFHPLRYLQALTAAIPGAGSEVFERSRVVDVDQGLRCRLRVEAGARVRAKHVIIATHAPLLDRGLYFARTHPERSYVLLARLRDGVPQGMYLSAESPAHSLRSVPTADGERLLVGGEGHKAGQSDAAERYRALEEWARSRFEIEAVEHRWAAQDNMPADGMPFVGRLWPLSARLHTATGLRKWGLAMGTAAARILADKVQDRDNPWAEAFTPMRLHARAAAPELLKETFDAGLHFTLDRVTKRRSEDGLEPGEGAVVGSGLAQRAVYRDEGGELHSLSARCTHLGCIVRFNSAERTWDCPCHGSRFDLGGEVIEGPAVRPLESRPS